MTLDIGQRVYYRENLLRSSDYGEAFIPRLGTIIEVHDARYRVSWPKMPGYSDFIEDYDEAELFPTAFKIGERVRYTPGSYPSIEAIGTVTQINPDRHEPYTVRWDNDFTTQYRANRLTKYEEETIMEHTTTTPSEDEFRQAAGRLADADNAIETRVGLLQDRERGYRNLLADLKTGKYQSLELPRLIVRGIELQRLANLNQITKLTALLTTLAETTNTGETTNAERG